MSELILDITRKIVAEERKKDPEMWAEIDRWNKILLPLNLYGKVDMSALHKDNNRQKQG